MKRKILSAALALVMCLGLLPGTALAAEDHMRTETLVLTNDDQANAAQGWSWEKTSEGYTLTLDNVDFNVSSGHAIEFQLDAATDAGTVTVQLIGDNRVVSTEGVGLYAGWRHRVLQPIVITGDSLEVTGAWYGIQFDNYSALEIRDAALTADATKTTTNASGDTGAYGLSVKDGSILVENSTLNATRIRANSLTCRDSQLTATAKDGGYVRAILKTTYLDFSGGKLTIHGPEGLDNWGVRSDCDTGDDPIVLSNCEIDIRGVQQGIEASTGKIKLDRVTGTVLTTESASNNSIYQNAAFDNVGRGTCTDCQILAHTGTTYAVHTYIYGDHTLTEDASWPAQALHIQEGCTLTVAKGTKLTLTGDAKLDFHYESGYMKLVNNGTLEFADDNQIWADLINNGTLLVNGFLYCKPENFTNNGSFDGILGDTDQYIYGDQEIKYDRNLGAVSPYRGYSLHVTDGAVLTIPSGKTVNAVGSASYPITLDTLSEYLSVADTGKLIVDPEGRLLLPAGVTQEQLDALRLSGSGTVKVGDENANWVTVKDGEEVLFDKLIIPNSMLDVTTLQKDGYLLQLHQGTESGELFDPAEPITTDLTLCARWMKVLPDPPADDGSTRYQVVMETGLSQVPEALQSNEKLNAPEKIETELKTVIKQMDDNIKDEDTAVYDVELMVSNDGGQTWEKATKDNFPKNGLTVTLPYPDGTDSRFTFKVVHMISTGDAAGTTEAPNVSNTAKGIQFKVTSLSPISVGWTEPSSSGGSHGDDSSDDSSTYSIAVEKTGRGAVTVDRKYAEEGTRVTITAVPSEGYTLDALTVTDRSGKSVKVTQGKNGKYTFTMPAGRVTVEAEFIKTGGGYADCLRDAGCPIWSFRDASTAAWYHDGVHYCIEHGLMTGYPDRLFVPGGDTSRAMAATILWRLQGSPVVNYAMGYDDVDQSAWYAEAVRWAAAEGIITGYGNGSFGPDDPITREQLAVMLWRYAGSPASLRELRFSDAGEAGSYAVDALRWAVEDGILSGSGDGRLDPKGLATRAQTAQMLKSLLADG